MTKARFTDKLARFLELSEAGYNHNQKGLVLLNMDFLEREVKRSGDTSDNAYEKAEEKALEEARQISEYFNDILLERKR